MLNEAPAHGRVGVNPEHRQTVNKRSGAKDKFRLSSWNVGTMRGRSGEIVETLARRKIDVCCVQEVRWRGASARMITGKDSEFKFFWVGGETGLGGVGILVSKNWLDKIIDVNRISDRLMAIKLLTGKRVLSIISTYAPQQGLGEDIKDKFYEDLIAYISKLGEDEFLILGGDLNGHVGRNSNGFEGVHGGFGYGDRNLEGERILELGLALDMVVCNTFFKKRDSRLVTYTSGASKTQIDYIMVRNKDKKFVKDVKVIPGEEVVQQHQLLVCDFKVDKVKMARKPFVPKRKVWKLKEEATKVEFLNKFRSKSEELNNRVSVNDIWNSIKSDLLESSDEVCGKTKGPPRHKVTWWWNDNVAQAVEEKRRLFRLWKNGGSKRNYLEAKKAAKRAVYDARKLAEEERFGDVLRREDDRVEVFKIAKQMMKTNQDVIGEKCVRNDRNELAITDKEKLIAWREHYEKLLNEEFDWDKDNLIFNDPIIGPEPQFNSEMVRKALSKMKSGKAAGTSGVVAEMLHASGELGIERLTCLFNSIIKEGRIPDDWNTSIIVNCFKNKGEATERGNYRGLKLLEHTMKVFERVIEQLIRDQVDIDELQFGFMPGRGTIDAVFIARQLQEKYLEKKKQLFFAFVDLEKAFDRVPREVVRWALRKLGVDEWIIRTIMAMYRDSNSRIRINNTLGEKFGVNVGVHQGSVLSPLLFIIVLEAISSECRDRSLWELLYADDLAIIAESLEELENRYTQWKNGMESKGLRVNLQKTKVLISDANRGPIFPTGKYPCGVCRKGVGRNSILCTKCKKWVHKKCSGVNGRLSSVKGFRLCDLFKPSCG